LRNCTPFHDCRSKIDERDEYETQNYNQIREKFLECAGIVHSLSFVVYILGHKFTFNYSKYPRYDILKMASNRESDAIYILLINDFRQNMDHSSLIQILRKLIGALGSP